MTAQDGGRAAVIVVRDEAGEYYVLDEETLTRTRATA